VIKYNNKEEYGECLPSLSKRFIITTDEGFELGKIKETCMVRETCLETVLKK
jgi:hypothetical protein